MDDHQNKSMALRALLTKLEKSVIIKTKYACMEPIIEENSLVRVTPISKPLKRGDILLIDQGYRFVTHRLLKIGRNGEYYTSGDNGCFFDTCDCQYTVLGLITSVKTENKWFEVNKPALLQYWLAVIGYAYIKKIVCSKPKN